MVRRLVDTRNGQANRYQGYVKHSGRTSPSHVHHPVSSHGSKSQPASPHSSGQSSQRRNSTIAPPAGRRGRSKAPSNGGNRSPSQSARRGSPSPRSPRSPCSPHSPRSPNIVRSPASQSRQDNEQSRGSKQGNFGKRHESREDVAVVNVPVILPRHREKDPIQVYDAATRNIEPSASNKRMQTTRRGGSKPQLNHSKSNSRGSRDRRSPSENDTARHANFSAVPLDDCATLTERSLGTSLASTLAGKAGLVEENKSKSRPIPSAITAHPNKVRNKVKLTKMMRTGKGKTKSVPIVKDEKLDDNIEVVHGALSSETNEPKRQSSLAVAAAAVAATSAVAVAGATATSKIASKAETKSTKSSSSPPFFSSLARAVRSRRKKSDKTGLQADSSLSTKGRIELGRDGPSTSSLQASLPSRSQPSKVPKTVPIVPSAPVVKEAAPPVSAKDDIPSVKDKGKSLSSQSSLQTSSRTKPTPPLPKNIPPPKHTPIPDSLPTPRSQNLSSPRSTVHDCEIVHVRIGLNSFDGLQTTTLSRSGTLTGSNKLVMGYADVIPRSGHITKSELVRSQPITPFIGKGHHRANVSWKNFGDEESKSYLFFSMPLRKNTTTAGKFVPVKSKIVVGVIRGEEEIAMGKVSLVIDGQEISSREMTLVIEPFIRQPIVKKASSLFRKRSSLQTEALTFPRDDTEYSLTHKAKLKVSIDVKRGDNLTTGKNVWNKNPSSTKELTDEDCFEVVRQKKSTAVIPTRQFVPPPGAKVKREADDTFEVPRFSCSMLSLATLSKESELGSLPELANASSIIETSKKSSLQMPLASESGQRSATPVTGSSGLKSATQVSESQRVQSSELKSFLTIQSSAPPPPPPPPPPAPTPQATTKQTEGVVSRQPETEVDEQVEINDSAKDYDSAYEEESSWQFCCSPRPAAPLDTVAEEEPLNPWHGRSPTKEGNSAGTKNDVETATEIDAHEKKLKDRSTRDLQRQASSESCSSDDSTVSGTIESTLSGTLESTVISTVESTLASDISSEPKRMKKTGMIDSAMSWLYSPRPDPTGNVMKTNSVEFSEFGDTTLSNSASNGTSEGTSIDSGSLVTYETSSETLEEKDEDLGGLIYQCGGSPKHSSILSGRSHANNLRFASTASSIDPAVSASRNIFEIAAQIGMDPDELIDRLEAGENAEDIFSQRASSSKYSL